MYRMKWRGPKGEVRTAVFFNRTAFNSRKSAFKKAGIPFVWSVPNA